QKDNGRWLMVIDNADDTELFFGRTVPSADHSAVPCGDNFAKYIPECTHGTILVTTRNKIAGSRLTKVQSLIEVGHMNEDEAVSLLRARLEDADPTPPELSALTARLEFLPLALIQAAAFIQENCVTIEKYLQLLDRSSQSVVTLLSEEFEADGRDSETPRAVTETWIISFEQIREQNAFAGELLSLMGFFDRQAIAAEFLAFYSHQHDGDRDEIEMTKALGVLKAFSLVTEANDQTFDIHRLVQHFW
ncbi:hypothetical protein ACHAQH_008539, partial [Verticillium albo-atrum]